MKLSKRAKNILLNPYRDLPLLCFLCGTLRAPHALAVPGAGRLSASGSRAQQRHQGKQIGVGGRGGWGLGWSRFRSFAFRGFEVRSPHLPNAGRCGPPGCSRVNGRRSTELNGPGPTADGLRSKNKASASAEACLAARQNLLVRRNSVVHEAAHTAGDCADGCAFAAAGNSANRCSGSG